MATNTTRRATKSTTQAPQKQAETTPDQQLKEIDPAELAEFKRWKEQQQEAKEPTRTIAGKIPESVFKQFDAKVKKQGIKKQDAIREAIKDWIDKA